LKEAARERRRRKVKKRRERMSGRKQLFLVGSMVWEW